MSMALEDCFHFGDDPSTYTEGEERDNFLYLSALVQGIITQQPAGNSYATFNISVNPSGMFAGYSFDLLPGTYTYTASTGNICFISEA